MTTTANSYASRYTYDAHADNAYRPERHRGKLKLSLVDGNRVPGSQWPLLLCSRRQRRGIGHHKRRYD